MATSGPYLQTVDRALQVLLQFDEAHPEWSAAELAQQLGLHRSIVYRILATLERRGFVTQADRRGRFRLGLKLVELGNVVLANMDLRQVAHPVMERLVRETGESAFLTVVSGDESVCVDKIDSPQPIRVTLTLGGRSPLHAGASNKILLAYLPPKAIDAYIAKGLEQITPDTITDPQQLKEELAQIRKQGWAYSVGELTPGVAAMAVPLRNSNGEVVAGLSIANLASRFSEDRRPMLIQKLREAADEISAQLLVWHTAQSPSS
ncbi:MAG TPA: IclR family transcriptional regulator [Caldilineae bacterium]|nr:IclR family transcriptional regulator [Caldilineae bacterium]